MDWRKLTEKHKKTKKTKRDTLMFCFKLLVSTLFIVMLCTTIPLSEVLKLFIDLNWFYVGILFILAYLLVLVSCLKWHILLKNKQIYTSVHSLVRLYLVGYFFNNFLPGMVGGDFIRGVILGRRFQRITDVFLSIFMERFTGFLALIFLTGSTVLINHPLVRVGNIRTIVILTLLASAAVVALVFSRTLFTSCMAYFPRRFAALHTKVDMLHAGLQEFGGHKRDFLLVLLYALINHLLTGVNLYYACLALNFKVDWVEMIVVTPFILLMSLLPVSINGIGLWESSFVLFFSLLGIPSSVALSAALLLRLKGLVVSALGGLFYLREGAPDNDLVIPEQPVKGAE